MPNRANTMSYGEKGHWHKGNTGAEVDKLGKTRYEQVMIATRVAKISLTTQLSADYAVQKRPDVIVPKNLQSRKSEAIDTAGNAVNRATLMQSRAGDSAK